MSILRTKSPLIMVVAYAIFVCVLGSVYLHRNIGYSVDDSFITYRYAFHLKEGYGLVFNVGEAYYGTTAAGYAAFLAVLSIVGSFFCKLFNFDSGTMFDVPHVSVALSSIALMLISGLLPVIARARDDWRQWLLSACGVVFLFSSVPFNEVAGHETYPFLATSLLGIVLVGYYRLYLAGGFFLAVAATFRPDAMLLGGIVPALDWLYSGLTIREYLKNRKVIGFLVVYSLILGIWLTYLACHFGSPTPGTMAAKKAQVALGYWPLYTPLTLVNYIFSVIGFSGSVVALIGVIINFREIFSSGGLNRNFRFETFFSGTWLAFGVISAVAYLSFNVTFWRWYGIPVLFSIFMVAFSGLVKINRSAELATLLIRPKATGLRLLVAILPSLVLCFLMFENTPKVIEWAKTHNINQHISAYSEIVEYIQRDSPNGATVQMFEPGSFGYHLGPKYTVIDELGLVSPGVAQALARGDFSWTLDKWHPKYLVCSWAGSYSACQHISQNDEYEYVGDFNREFWLPHIKSGAKLYRLRNAESVMRSRVAAIDIVRSVVLGDVWGKVDKGSSPDELFIHPGASTPTSFEIEPIPLHTTRIA